METQALNIKITPDIAIALAGLALLIIVGVGQIITAVKNLALVAINLKIDEMRAQQLANTQTVEDTNRRLQELSRERAGEEDSP